MEKKTQLLGHFGSYLPPNTTITTTPTIMTTRNPLTYAPFANGNEQQTVVFHF